MGPSVHWGPIHVQAFPGISTREKELGDRGRKHSFVPMQSYLVRIAKRAVSYRTNCIVPYMWVHGKEMQISFSPKVSSWKK